MRSASRGNKTAGLDLLGGLWEFVRIAQEISLLLASVLSRLLRGSANAEILFIKILFIRILFIEILFIRILLRISLEIY